MITKRTVIVLGAGASAPYGFPLGAGLVETIIGQMREDNTQLLRALHLAGFTPEQTTLFRQRLQLSDAESIDTFLENAEDQFVDIGRGVIANTILAAESSCRRKGLLIENPPEDHWLRYVWNLMRAGCHFETLNDNNVTFVSYNYDRVVEAYLDTVIENTFNVSSEQAALARQRAFPIIHLHGAIKEAEFGYFEDAFATGELRKYSAGVKVVHDSFASDDDAFITARRALHNADLICFLGFGYHPTNVERLQPTSIPRQTKVAGSIFGLGAAQVTLAETHLKRQFKRSSPSHQCLEFCKEVVLFE